MQKCYCFFVFFDELNAGRRFFISLRILVIGFSMLWGLTSRAATPFDPEKNDVFPVATQFSPVPSGKGWHGEEGPLSEEVLRDTVDNIISHGFTGLEKGTGRPEKEARYILDYARSRGLFITAHAGALERFGRDAPPEPSVYAREYAEGVRKHAEKVLATLKETPGLYNVFTYQDEPFHAGIKSFGYGDAVKAAFKAKTGYDLPPTSASVTNDPQKWLELINFRSDNFPEGWRQSYRIIKEISPDFKVIMTHDSHNTFGAGYSSHCEIAIDDVFLWGGDYADMFVFDIYPYMMFDFRFGECARYPRPRISQTHYSLAQMRNLTRTFKKELGFWFGTYNPKWFGHYLCPELAALYWSEREMSATAVAQGADFLLTGYQIPIDAKHWDALGEGLSLIQKAKGRLLQAPRIKARACMLFPRTHYIQMQEEYFNVGLSFELFQRAFGELDILHEEQIVDDSMNGYDILLLCDTKLLPREVAERIASFVRKGGVVIADCVPGLNTYKKPLHAMEKLFGVNEAKTDRIVRMGHWVPYKDIAPRWAIRPENPPDESVFTTDTLKGNALGQPLNLDLISPRPCTLTTGMVLAKTMSGRPGIVYRNVGKGHAFLLGFCLQDTYFKMWKDENVTARLQLRGLLRAMTDKGGVQSHVFSSNPDIEASLRANKDEAFLFVINHEAAEADTTVCLADIGFQIGRIVDMDSGEQVLCKKTEMGGYVSLSVPLGEFRLLNVLP